MPFLLDALFSFFLRVSGCSAATLFGSTEPFPSVAYISFMPPSQTWLHIRRAILLHATYDEPSDELRTLRQMPRPLHRQRQSQERQKYRSFLRTSQACRPSSDWCPAGQQAG